MEVVHKETEPVATCYTNRGRKTEMQKSIQRILLEERKRYLKDETCNSCGKLGHLPREEQVGR